jgi:hypothetical protein
VATRELALDVPEGRNGRVDSGEEDEEGDLEAATSGRRRLRRGGSRRRGRA